MTPWTVAHQAPLSMEVFRQESWSRQIFPSAGHLLDPRIKPGSCAQFFYHLRHQGSPSGQWIKVKWTWSSRRWQEWTSQLWNQWTKMEGHGKINSGDHYIYYCEQEFLRRNGVALIVNKIVQNAVLGYSFKNNRVISVCSQGKPFNITAIKVSAPITEAEEAEADQFYEHLQHLELTLKKMSFSPSGIRMQKYEVKAYLEKQARLRLAVEYKMKQDKGDQSCEENLLVTAHTFYILCLDIMRWSISESD